MLKSQKGENMHYLEEICLEYKKGASFEKICRTYGGVSVYIPKVIPNAKEKILNEFNGGNCSYLAYKYNLSEDTIRRMLRANRKTSLLKRKDSLLKQEDSLNKDEE